jgi:hypothetical protein
MPSSITNRNCQSPSLSQRPEHVARRRRHLVAAIACAALLVPWMGCSAPQDAPPSAPAPAPAEPTEPSEPAEPSEPTESERQQLTSQQCEAQGGEVVGDIGDGATSRPDYVCPSGKPPTGNISAPEGGPMPVEGAVCGRDPLLRCAEGSACGRQIELPLQGREPSNFANSDSSERDRLLLTTNVDHCKVTGRMGLS